MSDDGEDKGAQRRRALLHGAPQPKPREPNPGELLMTFEHGQDVYRVELRDFDPYGVEGQIFQNGILLRGEAIQCARARRTMGRNETASDSQGRWMMAGR